MSLNLSLVILLIAMSGFVATPPERIIMIAGGCAIWVLQWAEDRQLFKKQAASEAIQELVEQINDRFSKSDQS